MFAPRWRKVVRDLWLNKTRTFLVVLSIAVGVFSVGAVATARTILSRDLAAQYAVTNSASATIFASNLDEQFVRSIARMPEVQAVEGRRVTVLRVPLNLAAPRAGRPRWWWWMWITLMLKTILSGR